MNGKSKQPEYEQRGQQQVQEQVQEVEEGVTAHSCYRVPLCLDRCCIQRTCSNTNTFTLN